MKGEPRPSDEVLITVTNECSCSIKFYNYDDESHYLSDDFDCNYASILPIKVKRGKYKIKAENYHGKTVTKEFTKGLYSQEIDIEF